MIYINNSDYQEFINQNPGRGLLKIQAYMALQAIPLKGVKIRITKNFNSGKRSFFEGETNDSGIIDNITLPAPSYDPTNLNEAPSSTNYNIEAVHEIYKLAQEYVTEVYSNIKSIQYIKMVPNGGASNE